MSQKAFTCLVLIGLLLLSLTGCGKQAEGEGDIGKITLTLWYWNRSIDDELLKQVEKQFPHIRLKAEKNWRRFQSQAHVRLRGEIRGPGHCRIERLDRQLFP